MNLNKQNPNIYNLTAEEFAWIEKVGLLGDFMKIYTDLEMDDQQKKAKLCDLIKIRAEEILGQVDSQKNDQNLEGIKKSKQIAWVSGDEAKSRFLKWIKGETGYPLVDAAMIQLAKTGWMHNRARMMVASILTKNLGIDWRWGQNYFRAVLVDLDEASNNGGWQWASSTGSDPKPIRIFNPYLQSENYDSQKLYEKYWLGQKKSVQKNPKSIIHPIVEHKVARNEALKRYGLESQIARDY